jgi:hypothetical protein
MLGQDMSCWSRLIQINSCYPRLGQVGLVRTGYFSLCQVRKYSVMLGQDISG